MGELKSFLYLNLIFYLVQSDEEDNNDIDTIHVRIVVLILW